MDFIPFIIHKYVLFFTHCNNVLEVRADAESTPARWLAAVLFSNEKLQITDNKIHEIS